MPIHPKATSNTAVHKPSSTPSLPTPLLSTHTHCHKYSRTIHLCTHNSCWSEVLIFSASAIATAPSFPMWLPKRLYAAHKRETERGEKVEFVDLALRWESGRENTNAENSVMWSCLPNKQTNKRSSRGKGRSRSNKECSKQSNHANALVSLPPSTHTLPQAQPNHLCTYSSVCSVLLSFSASAIAAAPSAPRLLS